MQKLYKRSNGRPVAYYEAWLDERTITEHWGELGEEGQSRESKADEKLTEEENLHAKLAGAIADGYEPIEFEEHAVLLVEYAIDGMGSSADLKKRHELEERLDQTLGWTGLGNCDGGSIGSGTMEACCYVVDFETAKRVIASDLKATNFSDYSRIYQEDAG